MPSTIRKSKLHYGSKAKTKATRYRIVIALGAVAVGWRLFTWLKNKTQNSSMNRMSAVRHGSLPGCGNIEIWSHRTQMDDSRYSLDCPSTLEMQRRTGIRNFDVDVLIDAQDRLVVAHPSELPGSLDVNFRKAPCSNIPLQEFISHLRQTFTDSDFFLTMEPKANWPKQAVNKALSDPKVVVDRLLAELPGSISPTHCGIILSPVQLFEALGPDYTKERLGAACHDLVYPLPIRTPFQVPTSPYTMFMPTIEHYEALTTTSLHIPTVLWIVDDEEQLKRALSLPAGATVKGVITNRPRRMMEALDSICF